MPSASWPEQEVNPRHVTFHYISELQEASGRKFFASLDTRGPSHLPRKIRAQEVHAKKKQPKTAEGRASGSANCNVGNYDRRIRGLLILDSGRQQAFSTLGVF